jgi:hypothetical protein
MKLKIQVLLYCLFVSLSTFAETARVDIGLAHDSSEERSTREQLGGLLKTYNLSDYLFTRQVKIDKDAIPHSHPILTLHTRHLGQDDLLLSTFTHEEIHWFLEARDADTQAAKLELRKLYPKVPIGFPEGASDEESTYLHLIVNYLEYQAMMKLVGDSRALAAMSFWTKDHYTWVYKTMLADESKIGQIVAQHNLKI